MDKNLFNLPTYQRENLNPNISNWRPSSAEASQLINERLGQSFIGTFKTTISTLVKAYEPLINLRASLLNRTGRWSPCKKRYHGWNLWARNTLKFAGEAAQESTNPLFDPPKFEHLVNTRHPLAWINGHSISYFLFFFSALLILSLFSYSYHRPHSSPRWPKTLKTSQNDRGRRGQFLYLHWRTTKNGASSIPSYP